MGTIPPTFKVGGRICFYPPTFQEYECKLSYYYPVFKIVLCSRHMAIASCDKIKTYFTKNADDFTLCCHFQRSGAGHGVYYEIVLHV